MKTLPTAVPNPISQLCSSNKASVDFLFLLFLYEKQKIMKESTQQNFYSANFHVDMICVYPNPLGVEKVSVPRNFFELRVLQKIFQKIFQHF
jgi:hypothetical protein